MSDNNCTCTFQFKNSQNSYLVPLLRAMPRSPPHQQRASAVAAYLLTWLRASSLRLLLCQMSEYFTNAENAVFGLCRRWRRRRRRRPTEHICTRNYPCDSVVDQKLGSLFLTKIRIHHIETPGQELDYGYQESGNAAVSDDGNRKFLCQYLQIVFKIKTKIKPLLQSIQTHPKWLFTAWCNSVNITIFV